VDDNQFTALKIKDEDNVATLFCEAVALQVVQVRDRQGRVQPLTLLQDIPYGHKVAVAHIRKGKPVTKYGEQIGVATCDIRPGEHVHVHNIESTRGRGDWKEKGDGNEV